MLSGAYGSVVEILAPDEFIVEFSATDDHLVGGVRVETALAHGDDVSAFAPIRPPMKVVLAKPEKIGTLT